MATGLKARIPFSVPVQAAVEKPAAHQTFLIWALGFGALGLAWSVTTVSAFLPPVLGQFTSSSTLIGLVLSSEGIFALVLPLIIGPLSDATRTPLGRRRPYMVFAIGPMAIALALLAFMPNLWATAFIFFSFAFAYYIYEPPYRGLYPDVIDDSIYGRAQGAQHVMRGLSLGLALVLGPLLLAVWTPFPFVLAAVITLISCAAVIALVREPELPERQFSQMRSYLATPFRIVREHKPVRWFLVANTAWEATFAGMRTFVVLYITIGLEQSLGVSSAVLAVVGFGYLIAASIAGRLGDRFGLGRVTFGASVVYGLGMLGATFATTWHSWYYGPILFVALAGGTVMTLSWALLFKVMPATGRGAVSGLAIMTKGIGLLIGPIVVGVSIDIAGTFLESTEGFAAMWVIVALPVLLVLPLVARLSGTERELRGTDDTEAQAAS
ncbi:MAG: MFS transporter [Gaiellales bacterium]